MRIYDAFMWEKFTTQGIANLANFVKEGKGKGKGKVWTVQTQVEGLIAALRNPYTRNVSFRWADFCFIGQLDTVQAKYTMFSPAGRPVRAAVSLRLKHELDPSMLYRWYEDLDKAFTLGGATMLTRTQQYFQSLLNLGL